jgi:hypothetical protein
MNKQFVWSDAWILLAIIYAGDNGDRANIIKIADGINHAIPTEEELSGAFARLAQAGFIEEEDDKPKVSAVVMETYSRTHTPRRAILKELEDMELFLGVPKT